MKTKPLLAALVVLITGAVAIPLALKRIGSSSSDAHHHGHAHPHDPGHDHHHDDHDHGLPAPISTPNGHAAHTDDYPRGPRGGRLLSDGAFGAEILIYEKGVPPEFQIYARESGKPVSPQEMTASVELKRLGGRTELIPFQIRGEFLAGVQPVREPHSFDVAVQIKRNGKTHEWRYSSVEARVELRPEIVERSGIKVESAGPAVLRRVARVYGRVEINQDRLKQVVPRYSGPLREVRKRLGERVARDEILAVVESNQSLQTYEVRADLDGTIVAQHALAGEFAREGEPICVIADLSRVWVDLNLFPRDAHRVKVGQVVRLDGGEGMPKVQGKIAYVSPVGLEATQTVLARLELPNPNGEWRPGLFVSAEVVLEEREVPVAIRNSALQTWKELPVVFLNAGSLFEPVVVEPGLRDGEWIEIRSGLRAGDPYVTENSFIIKAEILKSGATHDH